jgi:Ti-type conjugative transfer relaxase TraA
VALAHLEVKIFTRSKGHTAVLKAAYRAGESLHDERLGLTWNYSRKRHVDETFILAPTRAAGWVYDREQLWNRVEQHERGDRAQLARELEISLPRELTHEQQKALLESFIHEHFVSRGMVADCVIHRPPAKPDHEWTGQIKNDHLGNPHAHVMLTMRDLAPDGFARRKNRTWNDWDLKNNTRAAWELAANRALEAAGRTERIDMRSFEDRGIPLEPQPKRYRSASDAHLDGRERVLEQNVEVQLTARRNGERILARPEIVLELLESKQSVFTEHQLLRTINRYTADAEQFERARFAVFASAELVELPSDTGPRRFSTRATVAAEQSLLESGAALAQHAGHTVSLSTINRAIASSKRPLTDEQSAAVRHLAASADLAILQGYAGSGKSTMLDAARAAWQAEGYTVVGGALAGKAAEGLSDPESPGIPSRTLAAWQWAWDHGRDLLTHKHVLVIDEAGMVGTKQMESILAAARAAGAKVVLVGDTRQLQAIDPGAPMRVLQEQHGAVKLTRIIRQKIDWQRQATQLFGDGEAKRALTSYVDRDRAHQVATVTDAQHALVEQWAIDRRENPTESTIVLTYRRKDVHALNQLARAVRKVDGELGPDHTFDTTHGTREFAVGDRIYFLKNDRELGATIVSDDRGRGGVKNGTLATIEAIEGTRITVRLDDKRRITFDASTYRDIDHGYAATVHKSQGVTVDRAYVLANRYMDASATYVAMSRHRQDVQLYYAEEEFQDRDTLIAKLSAQRDAAMAIDDQGEPSLPSPAKLDKALQKEQAFLDLPDEERLAKLAKWERDSRRPTLSAAQVLDRLPETKAAISAREEASILLAAANRALQDFREQHAIAAELRTASYRSLEAVRESAQHRMLTADRALAEVRSSSHALTRAARIASRHNIAIKEAHDRLKWGQAIVARRARDEELWQFVDAANAKNRNKAFRIARSSDEGKSFEVMRKGQVNGQPVFVLRSPADASFIVADARLFRHEPAVGTHAVLVGHKRNNEPEGRVIHVTQKRDGGRDV